MQKRSGNAALIIIVISCALLSVALLLWSRRQSAANQDSSLLLATAPTPTALPSMPSTPLPAPTEENTPEPFSGPTGTAAVTPDASAPAVAGRTPGKADAAAAASRAPSPSLSTDVEPPLPEADSTSIQASDLKRQPPLKISVASVAADPRLWPRQVVLQGPVRFPVYINGNPAGSVQIGRGSLVSLHKVQPDGTVELERLGSIAKANASQTDLLARSQEIWMRLAQGPAAVAPSALPVSSVAGPAVSGTGNAANPSTAIPALQITVTRDRKSEPAADGASQHTWLFHIKAANPGTSEYPALHGVFVAFYRDPNGVLRVASNQAITGSISAGGATVIDPGPVRIDQIDGYAVVLRDADGKVVGSVSTRDSVTRDWASLEKMATGELLPQ